MKAVVVGAGGLGSYFGAVLARAGHEVALVVRGDHATAIQERGLLIQAPEGEFIVRPACIASADEAFGADVVFVAVKSYSLDEVAGSLARLAERGSAVVPLLNGVDASERLRAAGVAGERLVDGVAYTTAFRTAPGVVERKGVHQRLTLGSTSGAPRTAVEAVQRIFSGTPIEVRVEEDIAAELWRKMAVVCSLAAVCGITNRPIGPIRDHPFGRSLQARAVSEVLEVGRARGVAIPEDAEARVHEVLDAFPPDFYPSVLHDLRSGRRTEMDSLGGVIARLGRSVGVDTPLYDAATCAVQLIEAARVSATPAAADG